MRNLFLFFITNIIWLVSYASRDSIILTDKTSTVDVTHAIEFYEDIALNTPIANIFDSTNNKIFKPVTDKIINFRNNGYAYWLHFNLINLSNRNQWILNIDFPTLTHATIFILNSEGKVDTILDGGTDSPENNKFKDYTSISHPFECNNGQSFRVYIKVRTNAFYILPVRIMTTESYISKTIHKHSLLGVLFGFVLAALIINIFLYIISKEKYSIILLFLMITTIIFMLYQYGFGNEPITFINSQDKDKMRLILFAVVELFFNLFTIQFLNVKKHKYLLKTLQGTSIFLLLFIAVIVMSSTPLYLITKFNPLISFILGMIWLSAGILSKLRNQRQAKIYVSAVCFLFFSNIVWIFLTQDKIPFNFITSHISIIGITFFILILTYGAIGRIYELRREQQRIEQLESLNILLEDQIEIRKKTEQTLRKSEEKYRDLIENMVEVIFRMDDNGNILYVSPSVQRRYGLEPETFIGKHVSNFFPCDEEALAGWYNLLNVNTEISNEDEYITPIGDKRYIHISTKGIFENGSLIGCTGIITDVTDKKLYELELLKNKEILTELNATKDKFFSIIAHDLINPFNALLGFSEMLVESTKSDNKTVILRYANNIYSSSKRLFDLVQNLLLWSRAQTGKIKFNPLLAELKTLVSEALSTILPYALSKKINIEVEIKNKTHIVLDQSMISIVIRNLVWNAVKYSNNGGKITVETDVRENNLIVMVADTGIGMTDEEFSKLFKLDKIYSHKGTSDEVGSGLGLFICKEFIDLHNGEIWVESTLGMGTKFSFSIPTDSNK